MFKRLGEARALAIETADAATLYYNGACSTEMVAPLIEIRRTKLAEPPKDSPDRVVAEVYRKGTVILRMPERGGPRKDVLVRNVAHGTTHHKQRALGILKFYQNSREARICLEGDAEFSASAFIFRNGKRRRAEHMLEDLSGQSGLNEGETLLDAATDILHSGLKSRTFSLHDLGRAFGALLFANNDFDAEQTMRDFSMSYERILKRMPQDVLSSAMRKLEEKNLLIAEGRG